MQQKIMLLNGPNLNLLGQREVNIYGKIFLSDIINKLQIIANEHNIFLQHTQSNHEGVLIDKIQEAYYEKYDYLLINLGAYTHTSIALRDAILIGSIPVIEIHISNIFKREQFRHISYFSDIATAIISGFGYHGYEYALRHAINTLNNNV